MDAAAEFEWWYSREIQERIWWAQEQGYCCWAGAQASPGACPWHFSDAEAQDLFSS